MENSLLEWNIYEVNSKNHPLTKNRVRGRLRKFALNNNINLLVENTQDGDSRIRFAVLSGTNITPIKNFLIKLFPDVTFDLVFEKVNNPVLSRTQVNLEHRYEL